jgi:hypothetical protein
VEEDEESFREAARKKAEENEETFREAVRKGDVREVQASRLYSFGVRESVERSLSLKVFRLPEELLRRKKEVRVAR